MKRFKKAIRKIAVILFILIACMIPVPLITDKKQGKFNDEHSIEVVIQKEENSENEAVNIEDQLKT